MRVLVSESVDKKTRTYIDVAPEFLLSMIETDYGLHEVINMYNPYVHVRLFFDVETIFSPNTKNIDSSLILKSTLLTLNNYYKTTNDDWAITTANRDFIASYHIYSTKYCIPLRVLRDDVKTMNCPYIDDAVYSFSVFSGKDEGSLRLPNQSKSSINKEGGIHTLIQGELKDCLVTQTDGLQLCIK